MWVFRQMWGSFVKYEDVLLTKFHYQYYCSANKILLKINWNTKYCRTNARVLSSPALGLFKTCNQNIPSDVRKECKVVYRFEEDLITLLSFLHKFLGYNLLRSMHNSGHALTLQERYSEIWMRKAQKKSELSPRKSIFQYMV